MGGLLEGSRHHFGALFGSSGFALGSSWGALGAPSRPLGSLLVPFAASWAPVGTIWEHFGAISWCLNPLHRRRICELLGVSGGCLGSLLGAFGVPWELLGEHWGSFGVSLQHLGALSGTTWVHFGSISLPPIRRTASNLRAFWSSWGVSLGCLWGAFGPPA